MIQIKVLSKRTSDISSDLNDLWNKIFTKVQLFAVTKVTY